MGGRGRRNRDILGVGKGGTSVFFIFKITKINSSNT
jgi:hypothetical protein